MPLIASCRSATPTSGIAVTACFRRQPRCGLILQAGVAAQLPSPQPLPEGEGARERYSLMDVHTPKKKKKKVLLFLWEATEPTPIGRTDRLA